MNKMGATTALELLRILIMVMGGIAVIFGINDVFGDGQQTSMGIKKIIGGVAVIIIGYFLMTQAINNVKTAAGQAGVKVAVYTFPIQMMLPGFPVLQ
jgi:hypothetical protein